MTDEIARLVELSGRATPGPWEVASYAPNEYWRDFGKVVCGQSPGGGVRICDTTENYTGAHEGPGIDSTFIAALVNWFRAHQEELKEGSK